MNVVDESLHGLAEFYLAEDKVDQAVAALERIAAESPDEETRSRTHYNLARIYREKLGDPDRARSAYARVTGSLARGARLTVIGALKREKRWDDIVAFLKECTAASTKPEDKAGALTLLIAMIRQSGDKKLIEATLQSVPDLISYKDAELAADVTRKEREKRMRERAERAQRARPPTPTAFSRRRTPPTPLRPTAGRRSIRPPVRRGPGALPATPPPATDVRVEGAAREKVKAQIRELERAGFVEQARRLREKLEGKKENAQPDQF
jgi:tetratricopeptide (TPR) repeat protein